MWGYGVAHADRRRVRAGESAPAGRSPRERLIDAATRLFCRYGVNSVGVDAIVDAAGTAKTTLYKVFGSKDGLVEAVLEREGRAWRTWFVAEIDGPGGSARERLARIGPALRQWFGRDDFYGCPFINAVGESDKADDRMRSLAIAHKKIVLERIAALCAEAGCREPSEVAHTLGLIIDGADRGRADHARRRRRRHGEPDLRKRLVGSERLTSPRDRAPRFL